MSSLIAAAAEGKGTAETHLLPNCAFKWKEEKQMGKSLLRQCLLAQSAPEAALTQVLKLQRYVL